MNSKTTEYPVIDGHRIHYAMAPVQLVNKKWVAVEILKTGGYISPYRRGTLNPAKKQFDKEDECQKVCDVHNSWVGFSRKEVVKILRESVLNNATVKVTLRLLSKDGDVQDHKISITPPPFRD